MTGDSFLVLRADLTACTVRPSLIRSERVLAVSCMRRSAEEPDTPFGDRRRLMTVLMG
jgi:hypothetical protein